MRIGEMVLGYMGQTKENEPQAEQAGGTKQTITGEPEMRVKIVPILGQMFGGNYAFLLWDEADPQKRAIAVDPADPYPVLRAAQDEGLKVEVLLCTHWHFDHSAGNRTFAKALPGLQVVASAHEKQRTPAVTRKLKDLEELQVGRLTVRGHSVPGHTTGSMVYEIFSRASPAGTPPSAFTGDAIFCGGCGALFECSANTFHESLRTLVSRLPPKTRVFPGHEYTEMLLQMAVKRRVQSAADQKLHDAATAKLLECMERRKRAEPSIPSTMEEELSYNLHLRADPAALASMCGCAVE